MKIGNEHDIYVLVCERDVGFERDGSRPIVFEQYLDQGAASLESVRMFQDSLGAKYGQTRIAKLQFVDCLTQKSAASARRPPDCRVMPATTMEIEMAREHFYINEEKLMKRILVLKELIAEQDLHEEPCLLLAAQLNELGVLCGRLQAEVRALAEAVKKVGHEA